MKKLLSLLASTTVHAAAFGAVVGIASLARSSLELAAFSVHPGETAIASVRLDRPSEPGRFDLEAPASPPLSADDPDLAVEYPEIEPLVPLRTSVPPPRPRPPRPVMAQKLPRPATAESAPAPGAQSDVPPVEISNPPPAYPPAARRRGEEGEVIAAFDVTVEGACANVRVERSSGHRLLDEAALAAVRDWRYRPAMRGGQVVATTQRVRFVFKLQS